MTKSTTFNEPLTEEKLDTELQQESELKLAVVVVSYNTVNHLRRCLLSLRQNPLSMGTCVTIVVDNASSDGSPKMVKKRFPEAYLIENSDNRGFAKASNQGIRAVNADYYLLLNSDAAMMGDALDVMVSYMDTNTDVGTVGGQIFTEDGNVQPSTLQFPTYWNLLFARSSLLARLPVFRWKMQELRKVPEDVTDVPAIAGGCMLLRSETLRLLGLLDERFFMYLEDTDICKRMWKNKWRVVFNPNARILHSWGASSKKRREKAFWWHHISMFKYFQKHYLYLLPLNLLLFGGLITHYGTWWLLNTLSGWRAYREEEPKNGKAKH